MRTIFSGSSWSPCSYWPISFYPFTVKLLKTLHCIVSSSAGWHARWSATPGLWVSCISIVLLSVQRPCDGQVLQSLRHLRLLRWPRLPWPHKEASVGLIIHSLFHCPFGPSFWPKGEWARNSIFHISMPQFPDAISAGLIRHPFPAVIWKQSNEHGYHHWSCPFKNNNNNYNIYYIIYITCLTVKQKETRDQDRQTDWELLPTGLLSKHLQQVKVGQAKTRNPELNWASWMSGRDPST